MLNCANNITRLYMNSMFKTRAVRACVMSWSYSTVEILARSELAGTLLRDPDDPHETSCY